MRTIHRDIVGAFIFSKDGKLLLGHNRKGGAYEGHWVVPGGGVDEGETKLEALRREMIEETGLDIQNDTITEFHSLPGEHEKTLRDSGERVLVKVIFYNYRIDLNHNAHDVKIIADDDWMDPRWFELQELANADLSEPTRDSLLIAGIITK